jgi:hypothetical protein
VVGHHPTRAQPSPPGLRVNAGSASTNPRCTPGSSPIIPASAICGMELTPVYEGGPGFQTVPTRSGFRQFHQHPQRPHHAGAPWPFGRACGCGIIEDDDSDRILSAYVAGRIEDLHVSYVGSEVRVGRPGAILQPHAIGRTPVRGTASRARRLALAAPKTTSCAVGRPAASSHGPHRRATRRTVTRQPRIHLPSFWRPSPEPSSIASSTGQYVSGDKLFGWPTSRRCGSSSTPTSRTCPGAEIG